MNILSLFNGMNCGFMALENLGIKVNNYFASEIDKHANKATKLINPKTIFLGDVTKVSYKNGVLYSENGEYKTKIDLILAGSPCQGFSFAGKMLNFNDERSKLFFDFIRIKKEIEAENPNINFFLENVRMTKESQAVISKYCDVQPVFINSKLLSAQSRPRLYWFNFGPIFKDSFFLPPANYTPQPKNKKILLRDILESEVNEKYFLSDRLIKSFINQENKHKQRGNGFRFEPTTGNKKAKALITYRNIDSNYIKIPEANKKGYTEIKPGECFDATHPTSETRRGRKMKNKSNTLTTTTPEFYKYDGFKIRRLTPRECFRLQTIPEKYINILLNSDLSDTQLYRIAGNGWTVDVISYLLNFINYKKQ